MIHHGDCLDVMAGMEPESIDAIVTDPPYGLEFMGKEWDLARRAAPRRGWAKQAASIAHEYAALAPSSAEGEDER